MLTDPAILHIPVFDPEGIELLLDIKRSVMRRLSPTYEVAFVPQSRAVFSETRHITGAYQYGRPPSESSPSYSVSVVTQQVDDGFHLACIHFVPDVLENAFYCLFDDTATRVLTPSDVAPRAAKLEAGLRTLHVTTRVHERRTATKVYGAGNESDFVRSHPSLEGCDPDPILDMIERSEGPQAVRNAAQLRLLEGVVRSFMERPELEN